MSAIPQGISREEWLQTLPQALVAGFVKTDIEFQQKGIYLITVKNFFIWISLVLYLFIIVVLYK